MIFIFYLPFINQFCFETISYVYRKMQKIAQRVPTTAECNFSQPQFRTLVCTFVTIINQYWCISINSSPDFIQAPMAFTSSPFPVQGSHPRHHIELKYPLPLSHPCLGQFFSASFFAMSLTALRSNGQVFCRPPLHWDLFFLWLDWGYGLRGGRSRK